MTYTDHSSSSLPPFFFRLPHRSPSETTSLDSPLNGYCCFLPPTESLCLPLLHGPRFLPFTSVVAIDKKSTKAGVRIPVSINGRGQVTFLISSALTWRLYTASRCSPGFFQGSATGFYLHHFPEIALSKVAIIF